MIKLTSQGTVEERLRHLEHSINYSEWIQAFPCADAVTSIAGGATVFFGGIAVDRSVFRKLVPDARWLVYHLGPDQPLGGSLPSLQVWGRHRPWLELGNDDLGKPTGICFSPDGRHLAWGSQDGTITVADLKGLAQRLRAFGLEAGPAATPR